jgi:hypothetical protein
METTIMVSYDTVLYKIAVEESARRMWAGTRYTTGYHNCLKAVRTISVSPSFS